MAQSIAMWKGSVFTKEKGFWRNQVFMITTVTHSPCTHPMQVELASTDSRASHSSCPVGTPLVDSFCSTSLQHPSFLGTDTPVPATKGQKARKTQTLSFVQSLVPHSQQIHSTLMNLIFNSIIGMFCVPQKKEGNHIVYSASNSFLAISCWSLKHIPRCQIKNIKLQCKNWINYIIKSKFVQLFNNVAFKPEKAKYEVDTVTAFLPHKHVYMCKSKTTQNSQGKADRDQQ